MRRTLLLAACLLALTGCSSGSDEADAKPSKSPAVSRELSYLAAARDITYNGTPSTQELLAYPPKWCEGLEAGHSVEWLFDMTGGGSLYPIGMEWGTAKADANELLVVGVKNYCPGQAAAVQEELRASGEY